MKRISLFSIFAYKFDGLDDAAKARIKDSFYRENYVKLKWSALFICLCQVLFIIRDCLAGFYADSKWNIINLVIEISMGTLSILFFAYASHKRREWSDGKLSRFLYYHYMIAIVLSVCGYTFSDMFVRHVSIGVCLSFLFVPVIVPFYEFARQCVLYAFVIVFSTTTYLCCFDKGVLGAFPIAILPILLFLTSCFLRSYFINILIYHEKTKLLTDELIYLNKTDFLTDIANRMCLYDDFDEARKKNMSFGAVMYDIDDFKKFNDAFSHLAGDDCLIKTCHVVEGLLKKFGGKLYRYGGEEFVGLFYGITEKEFKNVVSQINGTVCGLEIEHAPGAVYKYISVSVGGTYCADSLETLEKILLRCDGALYEAKSNGKNCYVIK